MPFEPVFETINVNKRKGNLTDQIKVECRTEISCEAVSKIINVSSFPQVVRTEVNDGQLKYDGKLTFFICYEDVDGNVRKCECGSEFSGAVSADGLTENDKAVAFCKCDKPEVSLSGIKLTASAYVGVTAEITENQKCSAVSGGENVIVNGKEITYSRSYGLKTCNYQIEEEFEMGYRVLEVINQSAKAVVTAVQCGVGIIIVDGEVYFSAIFLQSGEKRDIIRENRTIPFRMEIDCEDAMPSFSATAYVFDKSLKTEIAVDDNNGASLVSVSIGLGFAGEAYSMETASLATDAFCISENLELEKECIDCQFKRDVRSIGERVSGRAMIDEIPVGSYISCVAFDKAEISTSDKTEGGVAVTGILQSNVILCDGESKVFTRKAEIPFEKNIDCPMGEGCQFEIFVVAKNTQAKIISLTELDVESELIFTVYPTEKYNIECIKSIKSVGEKVAPDCAISVYIPTAGEDLWSLSKRLNVCPESLVATNKELQFPLSGSERIVVYRNR